MDKKRSIHYAYYTEQTWGASKNYALCLNSDVLGFKTCIEIIKNPDGYLIDNWRCPSADDNDLLYSNEIKNKVLNKFEDINVIQT